MSIMSRSFTGFPRPAILNLASESAFGIGIGIWSIALNFHLQFYGFSSVEIGTLISVAFISTAVSSFFSGRLSDSIGYPKVAGIGGLLVALSLLIIAFSPARFFFYIGQIIYGTGLACIMCTEFPLIFSLVLEDQKQTAYNLIIFIYFATSVLGNLFAGFFPKLFPKLFPSLHNPYQILLVVSAICYFILGIARTRLPRHNFSQNEKVQLRKVLFDRSVLSFLLFGFITMAIFNSVMSMMNIILRQHFHFSDSIIGIIFSFISIVGSLAMPLVSYLSSRSSNRKIAEVTLIVQALVIFTMSVSPAWIFVLMTFARTTTTNFVYSVVDSPMLQSIDPSYRGSYSGFRICANYIGMSLGSAIAGIFIAHNQYTMLFLFTGFLTGIQNLVFHRFCIKHIHNYSK